MLRLNCPRYRCFPVGALFVFVRSMQKWAAALSACARLCVCTCVRVCVCVWVCLRHWVPPLLSPPPPSQSPQSKPISCRLARSQLVLRPHSQRLSARRLVLLGLELFIFNALSCGSRGRFFSFAWKLAAARWTEATTLCKVWILVPGRVFLWSTASPEGWLTTMDEDDGHHENGVHATKDSDRQQRLRLCVLNEILNTERDYVRTLLFLQSVSFDIASSGCVMFTFRFLIREHGTLCQKRQQP